MLSNKIFLEIMGQLGAFHVAHFSAHGREIVLEWTGRHLLLATAVFKADGGFPETLKECVAAAQLLKWKEKIRLDADPLSGMVFLVQELPKLFQQPELEKALHQFLELAHEWEEILIRFAHPQKALASVGCSS